MEDSLFDKDFAKDEPVGRMTLRGGLTEIPDFDAEEDSEILNMLGQAKEDIAEAVPKVEAKPAEVEVIVP